MFPRTGRTSISPAGGGCTVGARTSPEGAIVGVWPASGTCTATAMPTATHQRTGARVIRAPPLLLLSSARGGTLGSGLSRWRRWRLGTESAKRTRDFRANLRIHVGGACRHHIHRNPVAAGKPGDVVVGSGQIVRNDALRSIDFGHDRAGVWRDLLADVESILGTANEGLTQVDRVVRDDQVGEVIATADQILGQL